MATTRTDLTSLWVDLGAAPIDVAIVTNGPALVYADIAAPAGGSTNGIVLSRDGVNYLDLFGGAGEHVYARAITTATVVSSASLPNGSTAKVAVTPTVTAATYAVSKVIGGILTFANALPAGLGGVLQSIVVKFKGSVQTVGFWVFIFDTLPTGTFTDTNTAAIAATDTAFLVGAYHLTTACSLLGTHTIFELDGIGKAIVGASTNLYAVVVPDATTAALGSTTDMTVSLGMLWG